MAAKKGVTPIGKRIKKARLDKKMSLDTMANETGLSTEMLTNIETGEKRPSVGNLLQISRAIHIDSGFLLKEQDEAWKKDPGPIPREPIIMPIPP